MLNDYPLKLVPLNLRQCNLVIATSQHIKKELLRIGPGTNPNRIIVKPNAINASQFPLVTTAEPSASQPFRIISVCRIEPKKGLIFLVDAIRILRDRELRVELLIVGGSDESSSTNEYESLLQARVAELNMADVIYFEGRKTESEIKRLFLGSHLFVAPFVETESGDKDGIPTSLLEAMSSGLAVVATDSGSISEVIENGREGILIAQKNSIALADAIASLINDSDQRARLGKNAAQKIREQIDVNVCEQIFHERLSRLLAVRRSQLTKNSNHPLVSVITIFFNAEKFIEEAIRSVLEQSYQNWEFILADDGSTDASTETAKQYAAKFPDKIRYFEHDGHQNRGMSATRNLGIRHASGKYVAFLDSDDVWFPQKLEQQVSIMESQPKAAMLYGAPQYWYSWTGMPEDLKRDYIPDLGLEPDKLFEPPILSTILYPLGKAAAPCPSDLLIRREVLDELGGFEEEFRASYQLYEDQAFLAKMYINYPVFVSDECWGRYRIHSESCFSLVTGAGQYESVRHYFLNWFDSYLSKKGMEFTPVWNALQDALSPFRQVKNEALENNTPAGCTEVSGPSTEAKKANIDNQFDWGTLRRLTPISKYWGFDRGRPIDRYYIENFLTRYSQDIRGHTLEVGDDAYTRKFGGDHATIRDVLHVTEGTSGATIIGDLANAGHIPSNTFNCIILTQTLHLIYDARAAIKTLHRILNRDGVLLATFPGITRISHTEWLDSWFWSFTTASARRLFEEIFSAQNVRVQAFGNVLTATSFLLGLATEELKSDELDYHDPNYEVLIAVRALKR